MPYTFVCACKGQAHAKVHAAGEGNVRYRWIFAATAAASLIAAATREADAAHASPVAMVDFDAGISAGEQEQMSCFDVMHTVLVCRTILCGDAIPSIR